MKRLSNGAIVKIPLNFDLGYSLVRFEKYDKIDPNVTLPEGIRLLSFNEDQLNTDTFLCEPLLLGGIREALRKHGWENLGVLNKDMISEELPLFKGGCETEEDLENGDWYVFEKVSLSYKSKTEYDRVKFLQPFVAYGTGSIEFKFTLLYLIIEGIDLEKYYDLNDASFRWELRELLMSPPIIPEWDSLFSVLIKKHPELVKPFLI